MFKRSFVRVLFAVGVWQVLIANDSGILEGSTNYVTVHAVSQSKHLPLQAHRNMGRSMNISAVVIAHTSHFALDSFQV